MTNEEYKKFEPELPNDPGVYRYFDSDDQLLYVGKAKDLRKRVASYFNRSNRSRRIDLMVGKIKRIEYTIVATEYDALLLENTLIKELQPKYNVLLRDDKTFPSVCIKNERFPRIFPTRKIIKDGSEYFGPYTQVWRMHLVLQLVKKVFPLRNCNYNLSEKNIAAGKFKACLEYQLGNCLAPCVAKQEEDDYNENIKKIRRILKGDVSAVLKMVKEEQKEAVDKLNFEQAEFFQKRIEALESFRQKSEVVNSKLDNLEVFTLARENKNGVVNYMQVNSGSIVLSYNLEMKINIEEEDKDLLSAAIIEIRNKYGSKGEILSSVDLEIESEELKYSVPKIGDKKRLIDLSLKNSKHALRERIAKNASMSNSRTDKLLKEMKADLRLTSFPRHIECIDNSNFQGDEPVAALVVFKDGKPLKKEYRHFLIKTVEGPDDFASMAEVVERRYSRLLQEGKALPDLLVVDGGKGQLSSAIKSLKKLEIEKRLPVIGIAKNLEELFYPNDPIPLHLDKQSQTLRVIQRMRDEAHRFGITHHRNRRLKKNLRSSLLNIDGIGEKTAKELLRAFGSVKRIEAGTLEEIAAVVGQSKAKILRNHFDQSAEQE